MKFGFLQVSRFRLLVRSNIRLRGTALCNSKCMPQRLRCITKKCLIYLHFKMDIPAYEAMNFGSKSLQKMVEEHLMVLNYLFVSNEVIGRDLQDIPIRIQTESLML